MYAGDVHDDTLVEANSWYNQTVNTSCILKASLLQQISREATLFLQVSYANNAIIVTHMYMYIQMNALLVCRINEGGTPD